MPDTTENTAPKTKKRNERTEAKFFEDADRLIAEAEREGADYNPPNDIAKLSNLKARRTAALAARTLNQQNNAAEETARNSRERLYQPVRPDVTSLVGYAKSAGVAANDVAVLKSIARDVGGRRAKSVSTGAPSAGGADDAGGGKISVSQMSYASIADNYSRFIEQYDSLAIETTEQKFEAETHRDKLSALRQSNAGVIAAAAASDTSAETFDRLAYTDADSFLNGCIAAKEYIKSKYGTKSEAYKNISSTRFIKPSRLR